MALLRDIAEACGVSIATVSIALRNTGKVAPETRAQIQAAAARLGYRPDPLAARLSERRFSRGSAREGLAIVVASHSDVSRSALTGGYLAERAEQLGFRCVFKHLPSHPVRLRSTLEQWHRQGVAGVIFWRLNRELPVEWKEWNQFSLLCCTDNAVPPPCHLVSIDQSEAVAVSVQALRAKGYRSIGFALLGHEPEIKDDRDRLAAALLAQAKPLAGERVVPLFIGPIHGPATAARLRAWFKKNRPDAIVGFNNLVLHWLDQGGWTSPRDFAFATLNYIRYQPEAAGYGRAEMKCAYTAIELLDQLIRHRETGWPGIPRRTLLPSRWIDGATAPSATVSTA